MTYIIAEPCVGTCDTACVEVCPVDCNMDQMIKPVLVKKQKQMVLILRENNFILIQKNVLIVALVNRNVL